MAYKGSQGNKLPAAPGQGKSHPQGSMGGIDAFSELSHPSAKGTASRSHPGKGPDSGYVKVGPKLTP